MLIQSTLDPRGVPIVDMDLKIQQAKLRRARRRGLPVVDPDSNFQRRQEALLQAKILQAKIQQSRMRRATKGERRSRSLFGSRDQLGAFTVEGNNVIPSDLETLGQFQGLQRMLNAIHPGEDALAFLTGSETARFPLLRVDGEIGPATLTRARLINQEMVEPAAVGELAAFLNTPQSLAISAVFVTAVLAARTGVAPNFTPDPAERTQLPKPAPTLRPSLQPRAKRTIGVGTIAFIGLLGLGLLGTIVYVVRR